MPRNPNAERDNPCLKEQEMSYKCLAKYNYDREKCEVYFANYKKCKEFWGRIRADRRAQGVEPHLPLVEDREKIKTEYLKNQFK